MSNPLALANGRGQRGLVLALERSMFKWPAEQLVPVDSVTSHMFADGVYVRSMIVPKGAIAVGKIHKTEHICIVLRGDILVVDSDGTEPRRIKAPAKFVSPAGVKRAVYAFEETEWLVVHPTHERDLKRIEAQFIAKDFDELEQCGALGESWALDGETRNVLG